MTAAARFRGIVTALVVTGIAASAGAQAQAAGAPATAITAGMHDDGFAGAPVPAARGGAVITLAAAAQAPPPRSPRPRARPRSEPIPAARWDFRGERAQWSRAALRALRAHGAPLVAETPSDIATWCPGYARGDAVQRRAFWVGFLSALAKHESTWNPRAVGGNGLWYGLLQILPGTARGYGCMARSGAALTDGAANLSCAIRILAHTVPRDGVIARAEPRWSGVAADWGPMRSPAKRQEMATWLRGQDYCQRRSSPRPKPRRLRDTGPLHEGAAVLRQPL
ncbi:transglycosylase SLT domain-containing protein [Profundibacterium mesophilum]|uniref:Soluble lytic transglycosylase n=1 Tax=Profundibacterium mesophilum KAUST100406-0324 TaxID=1037889 RepID=A0A921NP39_9RHOB|nr:transglycosylase SLT domain-containing protein [Profundibacterium mesophilum]KAF0674977.1 putative soluble lytic transglycosylase [Profundibacterium mesophilum KAUST100406-0324]